MKTTQQLAIERLEAEKANLEVQLDWYETLPDKKQETIDQIEEIQAVIDRLEMEGEPEPAPDPEREPKKRPCQIKWNDSRYCEDESVGYLHDTDSHPICQVQYAGQEETDPNQVTAYGLGYLEGIEVEAPTRDEAKEAFQSAFEKWLQQFYELIPFSVAYEVTH